MPCQACKEYKEKHVRYKARLGVPWGNHPADYSLLCTLTGIQPIMCADAGNYCTGHSQCAVQVCPDNSCPPPLPNSHLISNTCTKAVGTSCRYCILSTSSCRLSGTCIYAGDCYYDCDPPHVWNGVACVLPPAAEPLMDGFMYID